MKAPAPILSAAFKHNEHNNAASHSDPAEFAERMRLRRIAAQAKPENVTTIKKERKA